MSFSKRTIPHCISFATLFGLPCLALSHRLQSYNIASIDPRYVYSSRKLMVPPLGAHFASFDVSDTISRVFSFKSTLPSFIAHNVCVNVLEKSVTFYTDSAPKVAHYEHFASTYHLAKMLPRYKHSVVKGTMPNTTIINSPAYLALFDFDNANPYHWAMRLFFLYGAQFDTCPNEFYTTHPGPSLWQRQTLECIILSCKDKSRQLKRSSTDSVPIYTLNQHVCFKHAFIPGNGAFQSWFHGARRSRLAFLEDALGHDLPRVTPESIHLQVSILQRASNRRFESTDRLLQLLQTTHIPGQVVNVSIVEFHDNMTLAQSTEIMSNTDVLIGTHGAGLTHCVFLPPCSGILEVQLFNAYRPHYKILAEENDLFYESVEPPRNPFPEQHVCGGSQHGQGTHVPPCEFDSHVWTLAEVLHYDDDEMMQAFRKMAVNVKACKLEGAR